MTTSVGSAPGRLDLLGGVADYSGALVLQVPTQVRTTVTAEAADALLVGDVVLEPGEVVALAAMDDEGVRSALSHTPKWTRYLLGVAIVLVRHRMLEPPTVRLTVESDVPISMGASSSAALEVATARALGADRRVEPLRLAAMCQEAENGIVGAPCGIMDQVAVILGEPGAVLPIRCRPASVEASVRLPPGIEVVGWPSGAAHDVAGAAYGRARTAAFMGKRIIDDATGRRSSWTSELPEESLIGLPETLAGAAFLDRWGATDDPVSSVDPATTYPVRAATSFGVTEHQRTTRALAHLRGGDVGALGPLLAASHLGYNAMGLGHPATDAVINEALDRPGVHGARTSGGGCGGSVVVLCDRGALDDLEILVR